MHKKMIIALAISIIAANCFAGWEYTATTKSEGGKNDQQMNSEIHGWADGEKSKVKFSQSGNPMMPAGSYLISQDGGKTMYLVNPSKKKYATWDIESMMGMAGGAMEMMGIKFSTPKVEKLLEEKGPKISGFPTVHYRFRTSYTMSMSFMGMGQSTDTVMEEDVWATDKLTDTGLELWLNQKNTKTGNKQLDKMLEAEMSKVKGFPLKRVATTTATESDGSEEVTKLTSEVTSIKETKTPASLYEVPTGYKEEAMFNPAAMFGGQQDDAGDDDGASNENPFLKMMQQMQQEE